jgi:hypothetical protein
MNTTSRGAPWAWTEAGVVIDRESEGNLEQVWVWPDLPPETERRWHPLAVEVFCWYAELDKLNEALAVLWGAFGRDSLLVAMERKDGTVRVLVYTTASEAVAHTRYETVRGVLRPTAMGLRVVDEPAWDTLGELLTSLEPKPDAARVAPLGKGIQPGATR